MDSQSSKSCVAPGVKCPLEQVEWEFQLTVTGRQLKYADLPLTVLGVVDRLEPGDKKLSARLFLVMSELANNALDHGLLKLDSALKHSREGIEHYFEERAARLDRLEHGDIWFRLCKLADPARQCLRIDVRDSGNGFDHAAVMSGVDNGVNQARHGRGIALVKSMSGTMRYNGTGSEVHVCLPISGARCSYMTVQENEAGK